MKRRLVYVFVFLLPVLSLAFMSFTLNPNQQQANQTKKSKVYDRSRLFTFEVDSTPEQTKLKALKQYKTCPPLRPERFRRKVKMLWGIDVNDYPSNSTIIFSIYFMLSNKYQLLAGDSLAFWVGDEIPFAPPLTDDIYSLCRQYLFFADTSVRARLEENKYTYTKEVLKLNKNYKDYDTDFLISYDLLIQTYRSTVTTPHILLHYIDENGPWRGRPGSEMLNNIVYVHPLVSLRSFDMKNDLLSLYIHEKCKTRGLTVSNYSEEKNKTNVFISWRGIELTEAPIKYDEFEMHFPWHNFNGTRSFAGNLSFLIQLQQKESNSYVIQYMSGQLDRYTIYSFNQTKKERQDSIRNQIRSNNYYGYAILREFCENPEREMPTLEKVGTSFSAKVLNSNTLLYLEPYPDSYSIDTIQPSELFKAYEMGYDDYYFVEVVKSVESPVAGPDGYAMILDRTETVYGYIKKAEIKEVTESDTMYQVYNKMLYHSYPDKSILGH